MLREFIFKIDTKYEKKDIKWFLENIMYCSSNIITKLKRGDFIFLNNERETVRKTLQNGDILKIIIPSKGCKNILPNHNIKFDILYEDDDILAVDKPSGIPTHPSINHYTDTLANGVIAYINDADFTIHIVNRLDRETSGVVLFAKHMLSAHLLSRQIKNHEMKKTYYALTENIPPNEKGIINAPIARECESIIKRCVREDGKPSETLYKVLKAKNNNALILAEPLTGRTHQIRVHFSYINCPLAGDNLYGNGIQRDRLYLHCTSLFFKHPVTGMPVTVKSKLPEEFTV